jgi:hypothetical protein
VIFSLFIYFLMTSSLFSWTWGLKHKQNQVLDKNLKKKGLKIKKIYKTLGNKKLRMLVSYNEKKKK